LRVGGGVPVMPGADAGCRHVRRSSDTGDFGL
jgi:hypothetical protein